MGLTAALAVAGILLFPAPQLPFRFDFFPDDMDNSFSSSECPFAATLHLIGGVTHRVFLLWRVALFLLLIFFADNGCGLLQDKSRGFDFWLFCRFFCFWIRHNSLSFLGVIYCDCLHQSGQFSSKPPHVQFRIEHVPPENLVIWVDKAVVFQPETPFKIMNGWPFYVSVFFCIAATKRT